jgi:hypothetical protein
MAIFHLGAKKVTGYQAVAGANPSGLPAKFLSLGRTQGNPVFARMDELLAAFHSGSTSDWGKLAVLGDLFFTTDYALKKCSRKDPAFVNCETDLMNVYKTIVDKLCRAFACSVNVLPQKLEEWWGRVLTKHGHHVDTQAVPTGAQPTVAQYLTRAEAEKYRLRFSGGTVYMRERSKGNMADGIATPLWVPADSSGIGWTDARGMTAPQMMYPGYAGFALSMSREFYMAHHRGCFNEKNFFHSSYLAGDSVLCTGTMEIRNGRVLNVANDSGHYQPTLDHLLNVAQTLKMQGCDLSQTIFHAVWASLSPYAQSGAATVGTTYQYQGQWWFAINGNTLLTWRGTGRGLVERNAANESNIAKRLPSGAKAGTP